MAFWDVENTATEGQPIELYLFEYGDEPSHFYAYTTAVDTITLDGVEYTPLPSERDDIEIDGKVNDDALKLTVSVDSEIGELYRIFPPSHIVKLTIRQGHIPPDGSLTFAVEDFLVVWKGTLKQTSRKGAAIELTGELLSSRVSQPGLRRHYQWPCPLVLYGARCGANKAAATVDSTVLSLVENRLRPAAGWVPSGRVIDDFIGGFIEWDGIHGRDYRTILNVDGSDLVLNGLPVGLGNGDPVSVVLGCPHTYQGCLTIHNNPINYGGFMFIPRNNPTGKNNHY
jgi:hypothetical protein